MRIISQNGRIDIPYDNSFLEIVHRGEPTGSKGFTEKGYSIMAYNGNRWMVMAIYSSLEEAKEAMVSLCIEYTRKRTDYFRFPKEKENDKQEDKDNE